MSISSSDSHAGVHRKVIGLATAGAVGGFLFGFDSSVVNGAVDAMKAEFALSEAVTGFAVAVALLGCAAGAYLAGKVADRHGRVPAMKLGAALFLVSSIGTGLAFGVWDLIFWRLVGGLGIGLASVIAPAYISEISPRQIRGRLASCSSSPSPAASSRPCFPMRCWPLRRRRPPGLLVRPGGVALDVHRLCRPRRRLRRDRLHPAGIPAFPGPQRQGRRRPQDLRRPDARRRHRAPHPRNPRIHPAGPAFRQEGLLRGSAFGLQPVVWIGIILSVLQQFVGINVIFYYSTTLWKAVGFQEKDSLAISVATSITNILVTLVAIALVDRIGRRPILLAGSIGMAVSLGAMALAFSSASGNGPDIALPGVWGPVALVAANLFVVSFGVSWGPLVWVLLGEIFPSRIRGRALGLAAAAQWVANFAITLSFPVMAAGSLPLTYGMYALFAAASFFFVMFKVPETNGMSLEQAETLFVPKGAKVPAISTK